MKTKFYVLATFILLILAGWMFFSGSSPSSQSSSSATDLGDYQKVVLGIQGFNYYPNVIEVQSGKPVRIYMDQTVQGCYRDLVISEFNVRKYFTSAEDYVEFTPTKAGTYSFSCSMNMGRGKIIVK